MFAYGRADATAIQNLIVSCFIKIQNGFTFLVPAEPGCPGKEAINRCFIFVIQSQLHIVMNSGLGYITCFV